MPDFFVVLVVDSGNNRSHYYGFAAWEILLKKYEELIH